MKKCNFAVVILMKNVIPILKRKIDSRIEEYLGKPSNKMMRSVETKCYPVYGYLGLGSGRTVKPLIS